MPDVDKRTSWVLSFLTHWFIRILKRSKPEGKEELSLLGETTIVYPFRSDGAIIAQVTPFGTIIWNKSQTEQLSERAKRLVLRHECSHRDRNPIYKGVFLGMTLSFAAGCLLLLKVGFAILFGASPFDLMTPTAIGLGMLGTFLVLFRIEETIADYHALCELGEDGFLDAYEEISRNGDNSFMNRVIKAYLYTDPADIVRIYRLRQRLPLS